MDSLKEITYDTDINMLTSEQEAEILKKSSTKIDDNIPTNELLTSSHVN